MPGSRARSRPKTSSPKQLAEQTGPGIGVIDFDGTLAPFRLDPDAVRLSQAAARTLAKLSQRRPVAIVSGRPLSFLRKATAGMPLFLFGSHGAEASEKKLRVPPPPRLPQSLDRALAEASGARLLVERKPFGRVIHFRSLAENEREAAARLWAKRLAGLIPQGYELMRGNAVLEVRPAGLNKGAVLPVLRGFAREKIAFAVGDDTTDEDMFAALHSGEMGILAGERRPSLAGSHLGGVSAVREYLGLLAKLG